MSEPEDMSRFVRDHPEAEKYTKVIVKGASRLNRLTIMLTGTFDTPATQQEHVRAHYARWARAHRN